MMKLVDDDAIVAFGGQSGLEHVDIGHHNGAPHADHMMAENRAQALGELPFKLNRRDDDQGVNLQLFDYQGGYDALTHASWHDDNTSFKEPGAKGGGGLLLIWAKWVFGNKFAMRLWLDSEVLNLKFYPVLFKKSADQVQEPGRKVASFSQEGALTARVLVIDAPLDWDSIG